MGSRVDDKPPGDARIPTIASQAGRARAPNGQRGVIRRCMRSAGATIPAQGFAFSGGGANRWT